MCTRATVPWGLPKAPRIPVWSLTIRRWRPEINAHGGIKIWIWLKSSPILKNPSQQHDYSTAHTVTKVLDSYLSAPAQDNILLMRMTWKGCRRMRMWKPSLPQVFTMYLLAQIRAASRAAGGQGGGQRDKKENYVST